MKTIKILNRITLLCVSVVLAFTACKKKEPELVVPVIETPDGKNEQDSREVQSENDVAVNEINDVVSSSKRASGRSSSTDATSGICGFVVDSVKIAQDTILLKYNGVTCGNRTRTGTIRLSWAHGTKWKNAGAVIKVDYINYKIVRASDQKSIMLNGTQNITNVSGGTWVELLLLNQVIVNSVTGTNLNVTFEDNTTAVYNINRKITYTFPGSILTVKAEGIGTNGTLNNLENYGTARNGDVFTSQVTIPVVWNATCGGAVLKGEIVVNNVTKNISLKFLYGVDASGNIQTVGANACPYGWKLEWTVSGNSNFKVFGYN